MKRSMLLLMLAILFLAEILRVYFIMPFPGSQQTNTLSYAYWLNNYIIWIRVFALIVVSVALIATFKNGRIWEKFFLGIILVTYAVVAFFFNFRFEADKIFHQPLTKAFAPQANAMDKTKLVIGVTINGEAKAYPIQIIGYHHQVRDSVGNTPVMITYCTVCRTGRVFSPVINGHTETFRLVGMDHFNALFEDATTKSWWQQATGTAITGPLKGMILKEFPSKQLTLDAWLRQYPQSLIMQPDIAFLDNYFKLEDYDRGAMHSALVKRDGVSWKPKSWVIGVKNELNSKAYDWNELVKMKIIQDSIGMLPVLLAMESDTTSFHAYDRRVNGNVLYFQTAEKDLLTDQNTRSIWNMDGICIDGELKGQKLLTVQAYNEFWHSWQTFHRNAEPFISSN